MAKIQSNDRFGIIAEDYEPPRDPFGTDTMDFALKAFCREQGMDASQFWNIIRIGLFTEE